jgi:hypothetical protein
MVHDYYVEDPSLESCTHKHRRFLVYELFFIFHTHKEKIYSSGLLTPNYKAASSTCDAPAPPPVLEVEAGRAPRRTALSVEFTTV